MKTVFAEKKRLVIIAGLVVMVGTLAGVRVLTSRAERARHEAERRQGRVSETPTVSAFICDLATFTDELVLTGTIQGGARIEFRFNREGRIQKINYHVGHNVKRGAVVAELETGEAYLKLQQAEAELSQVVDLYRSGAVAKPRLTQAQLAAELARKEYDRSFIRAPRDGTIGEVNAEVGEFVTPQHTVATSVSIDSVYVEMGVIERDLGKLHLEQSVHVEVETYPNVIFKGRIARIAPQVEGTSRTRTVRAEIPNEARLLLPGMFARTHIFVREKADVLVVPATAARPAGDAHAVFVIGEEDRLTQVPVRLGYETADHVEIVSGLSPGDRIVATLSDGIREGVVVQVIEETRYEPRGHPSGS